MVSGLLTVRVHMYLYLQVDILTNYLHFADLLLATLDLFYLPLFQITPERNVQIVLKGKPLAFRETQNKVPLKGQ